MRMGDPLANSALYYSYTTNRSSFLSLSLSLSLVALVVLSDINSANADADAGILLRYPRDARFENETFDLRA